MKKLIIILLAAITAATLLTACGGKTKELVYHTENGKQVVVTATVDDTYMFQKGTDGTIQMYQDIDGMTGKKVMEGALLAADVDSWNRLMSDILGSGATISERGTRNNEEFLYVTIPGYDMSNAYFTKLHGSGIGIALYAESRDTLNKAIARLKFDVKDEG